MKKSLYFLFFLFLVFSLSSLKAEARVFSIDTPSTDLYNEKKDVVQVLNYNNSKHITITKDDIHLMAQVVYAESRAEPYEGKVAVASVILNRLLHPSFPKSVDSVVKQRNAFSCVINGAINVIPTEECYDAVREALKGKDPTNEAVFFYNPKIATSSWMKEIEKDNITPIGNHVFFVVQK